MGVIFIITSISLRNNNWGCKVSTETLKLISHAEDNRWPLKIPIKNINADENDAVLLAEAEAIIANPDAYLPAEVAEVVFA